jgi:predicted solute-binding protein
MSEVNVVESVASVAEARTQNRYRKSAGAPSKAAQTRAIIAELYGKMDQKEIVTEIQNRLGFTRQLARHYFYCSKNQALSSKE